MDRAPNVPAMRITIFIGILYLAILKARNPGLRKPALGNQQGSIVWGSVVPTREKRA